MRPLLILAATWLASCHPDIGDPEDHRTTRGGGPTMDTACFNVALATCSWLDDCAGGGGADCVGDVWDLCCSGDECDERGELAETLLDCADDVDAADCSLEIDCM